PLTDRYVIERELGRGGMAVVYLAQDTKLGRPVAIKVLHGELASALGHGRFLREIEITARLSHPRIIPVHDSGSVEGLLYYVMPFVRGESLRDRIAREGPLSVEDAVSIALSAASALAHAHEQGVVHRDIKPENILIASGEALVADFGIGRAAALATDERITQTGVTIGTPAYMSPEQSTGDPALDGRSDLFSLGCVLYEMLVGEAPFRGPTLQATIARAALEPMPSIRSVRPGVSTAIENVVRRALEKLPADRFPTASAFAAALSQAAAAPATTEAPTLAMSSLPKRRRPNVAMVAAGVLVCAAAAGGVLFARRAPPRSGIAVLGFDNHGSSADDDYIGAGLADEIT
ncbi:MAG: serine/threonine-protein kinase, partial [Solirubrobacteraceae bacterium]